MEGRPPPTLKDVALAAGLSPSTVSYALRNAGTVSRSTCERVREIAGRLGYRPNALLAALGSRRFRPAGRRIPVPVAVVGVSHGAYSADNAVEPAVTERARSLGYSLVRVDLSLEAETRAAGERLYHRGVAGVILGQLYGRAELPEFPWERFAVVSRGRQPFPVPFPVVRFEIFGAVQALWERLRARGYRRVGWAPLRHEPEHPDDRARHAAALYCIEHAASRDRIPLLKVPFFPSRRCNEAIRAWVREHRPEVVVGFHGGFVKLLRDAGWRVPEEIGVATLHADPADSPEVSGIVGASDRVRVQALELLDYLLRRRPPAGGGLPFEWLVPTLWHEGRTLRVAAGR